MEFIFNNLFALKIVKLNDQFTESSIVPISVHDRTAPTFNGVLLNPAAQ